MSDPIAAYQAALVQLKDATVAAEAVVSEVSAGARSLTRWREAIVSNVPGGGGYPAGVALNRYSPSINASHWPSAEAIHKALVAWHSAQAAVNAAWSVIPTERRVGLKPPA